MLRLASSSLGAAARRAAVRATTTIPSAATSPSTRLFSKLSLQSPGGLIAPHGGQGLVTRLLQGEERSAELQRAKSLPQIPITSRENGDLIMMGIGGFSPLSGFMDRQDWQAVCDKMTLADQTFWPIPITMSMEQEQASSLQPDHEVALVYHGETMATMKVSDVFEMTNEKKLHECQTVFTTTDQAHPGVQMVMEQKPFNVGGSVNVLSEGEFPVKYANVYKSPQQTRDEFAARGWKTIAALQLRNPMHRSHEYLAKIAAEVCDGVFIHSLVGNLKPGDIPAGVRVKCIEALVDNYFVPEHIMQGGYPLDMRYAGPREALLHALFRQNYGTTHMIIGRDHAGVGDYYGMFDAQAIFDTIPVHPTDSGKNLLTQPLKLDWTFYCHQCDGPASLRTCPHDKAERVMVSGTMLRKLLSEKGEIPDHFGRPEVLAILREYYEGLEEGDKVEVKLHGAATGQAMK
jgi:sulfate adenylyltransferase